MNITAKSMIILGLLGMGLGCDSDYTLGNSTPDLGNGSPTETEGTPPEFTFSPTPTGGTEDPGGWVLSLRVEPQEADFGYQYLGCADALDLHVINDGTVPVTLNNLRQVGRSESLIFDTQVDFDELLPGEYGMLTVNSHAMAVGDAAIDLHINIDEADEAAAIVPLFGSVADGTITVTDVFQYTPLNDVDVLWIIDNSGSMGDDQEAVAANFETFMNAFVPMGIHYHMGVTTTDMMTPDDLGKLRGSYGSGQHYIDWTLREAGEDAFEETIRTLGTDGSPSEKGLQAMDRALSPELLNGWNYGFLREDADLAVIFVSDEEDQSPGAQFPAYHQEYLRNLEMRKGDLDRVVCSSIIDYTEPRGYIDMASETGGVIAEIGGDYADILLEVGLVSAGQLPNFDLSEAPEEVDAVVVTVNGEEIPPGEETWFYDTEAQEVVFVDGALGEVEAVVVITYTAQPTCFTTLPEDEDGSGTRHANPPIHSHSIRALGPITSAERGGVSP